MKLYQFIAMELVRRELLQNDPIRKDQFEECEKGLKNVEINWLPHGSGFDKGCKLDSFEMENGKLKSFSISFGYHHMNENGYYTHWKDYKIKVTPDWSGCDFTIEGIDKDDTDNIKEYFDDMFALNLSIEREYSYVFRTKNPYSNLN